MFRSTAAEQRMHSRLLSLTFVLFCLSFMSMTHAQPPSKADFDQAMATQLPDDPAAVVAVVGESKILLGDLKPRVDARIKSVTEKTQQEIPAEQLHFANVNLTRQMLAQAIQTKMMAQAFIAEQVAGADATKRREANEMMATRARQMFYENEVPQLLEKFEVKDLAELDDALQETGSSVTAREREFADSMFGHMFMRSSIQQDPEIPLSEIVQTYRETRDEYKHRAKVKWEQLSVLFSNHSRDEAKTLIWEMGREAYFGGNMQAVAKAKSEEAFASEGGLHDWTNQGSLASKELDTQLFSLPLNAMSQLIEDENGYHIIRILDRKPAGVTPLKEVQEAIKKELQQEKIAKSQEDMIKSMQGRIPVWTIFPDDFPGAKPLPISRVPVPVAGLPSGKTYR